jgi:hypothetical protein
MKHCNFNEALTLLHHSQPRRESSNKDINLQPNSKKILMRTPKEDRSDKEQVTLSAA